MDKLLAQVLEQCRPYAKDGRVANYIPELAKADPDKLGLCIVDQTGTVHGAGDWQEYFTMQSVVKPLILLLALMDSGIEKVRALVGVEATGKPFDAFNYSDQALTGAHINPMINTGAIALCTLIKGRDYGEKFDRLLALARRLSGDDSLTVDAAVYFSEKATGNKNRALAYMLMAYGLVHDDANDILECYFRACSIRANCAALARIGFLFAHHGKDIVTGEQLFDPAYARYVNATLMTCGMYDGSGEFALQCGFPAKSGVGGGIMGVVPRRMGLGVFAPALDKKGNSMAGVKSLEELSKHLELSVF